MSTEAIDALHQRIKDLAANSTADQLAYLAKALESIIDKKATFSVVKMTEVKEVIDALQKRVKDLAANSTPDQLAYLAKALEAIIDKSAVSEIVQMTDGKLGELLNAARLHLDEISSNKENSISAITAAKTESVDKINTLKTNFLADLKASSDSHISLLDTRKDANIEAINSVGEGHKEGLKGLVEDFRAVNNVPPGSSIIGEIETRIKNILNEVKTRDEQLKNTFEIISDPDILSKTINENELETWLDNSDNQEKFKRMLNNASAVLNIAGQDYGSILGISPELDKLIGSEKAVKLLLENKSTLETIVNALVTNTLAQELLSPVDVMLNALADQRVVSIITASLSATERILTSFTAMKMMAQHDFIARSIAESKMGIDAIISNTVVLNMVIKSEVICKEIEASVQNRRKTIVESLEYSSWLFRKQTGVTVGNGGTMQESGRGSATIYIPTASYDNNNTDFSVSSLLTESQLVQITKHRGTSGVYSGIALRGVKVSGTGGSSGNVTFDVYTAL